MIYTDLFLKQFFDNNTFLSCSLIILLIFFLVYLFVWITDCGDH